MVMFNSYVKLPESTFQIAMDHFRMTQRKKCASNPGPRQPAEVWVQSEFMWTATSQQISPGKMGEDGEEQEQTNIHSNHGNGHEQTPFLYVIPFMCKETDKPHAIP